MNMRNNTLITSGAIIFKDLRGKPRFFVVKQTKEGKWEIPKVVARKGESSVRASLRMAGETAAINGRVLEEVGRYSGSATVNGKLISQKFYYYLMLAKSAGPEIIGFDDYAWLEYGQALKKIDPKREKNIFKQAKDTLKAWQKQHQKKN